MKPTKANLECADVILQRHLMRGWAWEGLRRDIAIALTLAERAVRKGKVNEQRSPSSR